MLAAFLVLLRRYTGHQDLVLGTPVANRGRAELEQLVGLFLNTLVLRCDLSGNPTFRELLGRVRRTALEAYGHQDLPIERLVEELQPERDLSRTPLFQVMFTLIRDSLPAASLGGLEVSRLDVESGTSKFDLNLTVVEQAGGLSLGLEYNSELFDAATMERLLGHYQVLLEGIVADPEQRLEELPLLMAGEREQLEAWNRTKVSYEGAQTLPELFETQVERTPERVAVVFEGEELSYRELNRRANEVAHHLRRLGVGPEGRVGLCLAS